MQSKGTRLGIRLRRLAALAPVIGLLSGCGFNFSLLPSADELYRTELADWQRNQMLAALLGAMPQEVASGLPDEQIPDAARFLTRTLETAPDGQKRHWKSLDRKAILDMRMVSTAADGETICRQAVLSLENAETSLIYKLQACRLKNGTWTE